MGKYLTDLQVEKLHNKNGRKQYRLTAPLIYDSKTVGLVIVPAGFITDFASVPRLPFIYLLFGGVGDEDAVLHDWLYKDPHNTGTGAIVSRSLADKVFRGARYASARIDLSEYESVNPITILINTWAYIGAWCMWAGVRLFGWRFWQ